MEGGDEKVAGSGDRHARSDARAGAAVVPAIVIIIWLSDPVRSRSGSSAGTEAAAASNAGSCDNDDDDNKLRFPSETIIAFKTVWS